MGVIFLMRGLDHIDVKISELRFLYVQLIGETMTIGAVVVGALGTFWTTFY